MSVIRLLINMQLGSAMGVIVMMTYLVTNTVMNRYDGIGGITVCSVTESRLPRS